MGTQMGIVLGWPVMGHPGSPQWVSTHCLGRHPSSGPPPFLTVQNKVCVLPFMPPRHGAPGIKQILASWGQAPTQGCQPAPGTVLPFWLWLFTSQGGLLSHSGGGSPSPCSPLRELL